MGTGFEKFEKSVMGESPINLQVTRKKVREPEPPKAEPKPEEEKKAAGKGFQFGVHVDEDTRRKIDELRFKTGMKIRELIIEAVAVLYKEKIEKNEN